MNRILIATAALLAPVLSAAQGAPFCVVPSYGGAPQCTYYSADQCRSSAATMNGMCVASASLPRSQADTPRPSAFQSFLAGQEAGQRARAARQREADSVRPTVFMCTDAAGRAYLSWTAQPGCVVVPVAD